MYEKNLDYFRGLFSIIVMLAHAYQIFLLPLYYKSENIILKFIPIIAAYSVVGFILISGYSIAGSLHNNYIKNSYLNINDFAIKRIKRIYPPLILSLLVIVLVVTIIRFFQLNGSESYRIMEDRYVARNKASIDWYLLLLNLFYLPRVVYDINTPTMNGPLWSLNFEVYYYFILLLTFKIAICIKTNSILNTLVPIMVLFVFLTFQFTYHSSINRQFLYLLLIFLFGSLSYYIVLIKYISFRLIKYLMILVFIIQVLVAMLSSGSILPYKGDTGYLFMVLTSFLMVFIYACFLSKKILKGSFFSVYLNIHSVCMFYIFHYFYWHFH